MKSIYVLAVLAVVSLSFVPIIADESDASAMYLVNGDRYYLAVDATTQFPEDPVVEDMKFMGWSLDGIIIDIYSYDFIAGEPYVLRAVFEPIQDGPSEPGGTVDSRYIASILVIAAILIFVAIALLIHKFTHY